MANIISDAKIWRCAMFRLGLKKDEKEILVSTIDELRGLRAQLSLLKEALAGMMPAERAGEAAGEAAPGWGGAAPDGGAAPGWGDQGPGGDDQGPGGEAAGQSVEAAAPEDGYGGRGDSPGGGEVDPDVTGEAPAPEVEVNQEGTVPEEPAGLPGSGRDWAVVSIYRGKRPWWKLWETEKRGSKRSI